MEVPHDGPTSKADCLNNVLDAIFQFEQRSGIAFAGFILHDSEDVLSRLELRLFNFLVDRKDLIQLPVYPLPGHWYQFTRSHYLDEFAETHGKDVIVREALIGQVPSAGVGTCFSRRAIQLLQEEGDGVVFDTKSLTEDYDIGFRLAAHGLHGVFVRFEDLPAAMQGHDGHSVRNAQIGVRAGGQGQAAAVGAHPRPVSQRARHPQLGGRQVHPDDRPPRPVELTAERPGATGEVDDGGRPGRNRPGRLFYVFITIFMRAAAYFRRSDSLTDCVLQNYLRPSLIWL